MSAALNKNGTKRMHYLICFSVTPAWTVNTTSKQCRGGTRTSEATFSPPSKCYCPATRPSLWNRSARPRLRPSLKHKPHQVLRNGCSVNSASHLTPICPICWFIITEAPRGGLYLISSVFFPLATSPSGKTEITEKKRLLFWQRWWECVSVCVCVFVCVFVCVCVRVASSQ